MVTIQILSDGYDRYTLEADSDCLGRRYDNISEAIRVIKPEVENGRKCEIIVKSEDEIIEYQEVQEETVDITTNISQHNIVSIGFTFSDDSGYIKNSESKDFYFAGAIKPQGFIDIPSDKMNQVIEIINNGFVKAEYSNNMLVFYNTKDEVVGSVEIISGEDFEYTETDPTVPAWAKQPEKPKYIYSEIEGTPLIPSIDGLASESFVNTKTSEVLNESKTYTNQKVADLVNSAPETLDTLGELAVAIEENESVVDAINQAITNKADKNEIPTNVVDTISDQNITGTKTFDKVAFSDDVVLEVPTSTNKRIRIGEKAVAGGTYCVSIGNNTNAGGINSIAIGVDSSTTNNANGVAIGNFARTIGMSAIAIGNFPSSSTNGVALGYYADASYSGIGIGYYAKSTAREAIQLGQGTNSTQSTFQVFDYQVLDANGQIPIERLGNVTSLIETSIVGVLNTEV